MPLSPSTDPDNSRQAQVPTTLPPGRQAGVGLHIASLPGPYGIGEIGAAARQFVDVMRRMHLSVWQFLPTGPTAYGDSPYQPLSTFAGNEMLIDIGDLVGRGLLQGDELAELTKLPMDTVDYGALIPAKTRLLRIAAGRFRDLADRSLLDGYSEFLEHNDACWLHDYALFRLLKTRHDERPWPEWAEPYVRRDPEALRQLEQDAEEQIEQIKVMQFLFHHQWQLFRAYANANGVWLFGDMPICIALDSADAWVHRELLELDRNGRPDRVAGVPPDYFSEDGQLWGNPLYAWKEHARTGFRWWVERLQAATELANIVRIDHFRGFEAYWSIPAESETARVGAWIPGPGDAFFDAIRDALGHLPIVAEDLGVITPEVDALRERQHLPGMVVLQFCAADEDFDLEGIAENCVCYTGTHDNDTTVGWFKGSPDDLRSADEIANTQHAALKLTGGTAETIHHDLIKVAFSSNARLAIAPMQDFLGLGSEARLNTPGTSGGNWRWRIRTDQVTDQLCSQVAGLVTSSGRGPAA